MKLTRFRSLILALSTAGALAFGVWGLTSCTPAQQGKLVADAPSIAQCAAEAISILAEHTDGGVEGGPLLVLKLPPRDPVDAGRRDGAGRE